MPGPPKTPTAMLARRGSWRAKVRDRGVEPPEGVPTRPAWVRGPAARHWKSIAEMLDAMGVMSPAYTVVFALLINSLGNYIEADKACKKHGEFYENDKGNWVAHPAARQRQAAWEQVLKASKEFGLTPASVAGLGTGTAKRGDGDDKNRFFAAKAGD